MSILIRLTVTDDKEPEALLEYITKHRVTSF